MFYSTRSKLIASFLGVVFLVGVVSLIIGGQLLYKAVLSEAMNRVRLDLNAAREIYLNRIKSIVCPLSVSSMGIIIIFAILIFADSLSRRYQPSR